MYQILGYQFAILVMVKKTQQVI